MGEIDGTFRAWGLPRGGTGAISESIGAAARELGAEIRMQAPVAKILAREGKAAGVVLENGEELHARCVTSSCDPNLTFLKWTDKSLLPDEFLTEVKRYKFRGSSGKVNLALDGLPELRSKPGHGPHLRGAISISPSMEYMERAYDDAKYGHFSRRPYVDTVIPTLTDPSMAPPGKHTMSCFVQYAPYKLAPGLSWDAKMREDFGNAVINALSEHMPNLKSLIVGKQVLSPADVQETFGLTEGNIFQGELSLEQLFFLRPVAGWARYRTPVKNLYMCGSATHPGGGIMGAPGRLGALAILDDFKKRAIA
jgi:phytoene dehydrogenase-like protein